MKLLFLSPSVQEFNLYVGEGNEEYYMNLIADAMEPYLYASGISFSRNNPEESLGAAIAASNAGNYQLHLAIHSNAAPESLSGQLQGADVYYYPSSTPSLAAAEIIARNYRAIYPDPEQVNVLPGPTLRELRRTIAPAVLLETAYHDNPIDAQWIRDNIGVIARNLVLSLSQIFNVPFNEPSEPKSAVVITKMTSLNLRLKPTVMSPIIGKLPKGAYVTVYGGDENWTVVGYGDLLGFAQSQYLAIM